jgi:GNAT superfamily N-acetyltransferase
MFLRTNMVRPAGLTDSEAAYLTHVDYRSTMALVALIGAEPHGLPEQGQIVAVARYACSEPVPSQAEAAIMVEDAYQRRGLGRQLMARLVAYACDEGITSLIANFLPENGPVLRMICGIGLPVEYFDVGCGEYQVAVSLARRAGSRNLPARAAAWVGRALRWPWDLPGQFVSLFRGA